MFVVLVSRVGWFLSSYYSIRDCGVRLGSVCVCVVKIIRFIRVVGSQNIFESLGSGSQYFIQLRIYVAVRASYTYFQNKKRDHFTKFENRILCTHTIAHFWHFGRFLLLLLQTWELGGLRYFEAEVRKWDHKFASHNFRNMRDQKPKHSSIDAARRDIFVLVSIIFSPLLENVWLNMYQKLDQQTGFRILFNNTLYF